MAPHFDIERRLLAEGKRVIAGADEAGRGALAGPLSVGLVVFPAEIIFSPPCDLTESVRDSKTLSPNQRLIARDIITKHALHSEVCLLNHRVVDMLNINGATCHALRNLVARSRIAIDTVIFDGRFSFEIGCELISVVDGDALCLSVAAASILAKVRRDEVMEKMDAYYPGYRFAAHKGYGTAEHRHNIALRGPSPIHRRTYEPVKSMIDV